MPTRIRPGQFYLARFTKNELLVRIEEAAPQGGWIARALSHGRKVMIKEESQIIHACDENGVELVANNTVPNRRSTACRRTQNRLPRFFPMNRRVITLVRL
jgi:hypothetical protein